MKTLMLALTMLCCTAWLAAQTTSGSGQSGSGNTSPDQTSPSSQTSPSDQTGSQTDSGSTRTTGNNANETTIQGCLSSSGGNYMLTDASGTQYQLQGDTSKLQSHANQEVQVKGMASSGSSASGSASDQGMGTQGTGTATTAGNTQMFTVSKVKKVSGTCTSSK